MDAAAPLTRRDCLAAAAALVVAPAIGWTQECRQLFGSPVDLLLPPGAPPALLQAVWQGLAAMDRCWNAWKPGDVHAVNRKLAAGQAVYVGPALRRLIAAAAAMEQLSGGLFRAGIGGLVGAWGFHNDRLLPGPAPRSQELARWRAAPPSLAQLEWRGPWLHSHNPLVQLDFGGYAKGVALDWALDRLQRGGAPHALLNLGGNLAVRGLAGGRRGDGAARPWRVGIRDPRDPLGSRLVAQLDVAGPEAVVTSGTYQRYRLVDGQRCGHVIDPILGCSAAGLASVTVVHRSAALADAAATALLVAGPLRWPVVADRMGVKQVLVIEPNGHQVATPALAARLKRTR